jgi:hypothetical protein
LLLFRIHGHPPQWAVKAMNRATADNQSAQSEEEGLEPTKEWVKDLLDEIIADEFASPDLELHWLDEDEANTAKDDATLGDVLRYAIAFALRRARIICFAYSIRHNGR